MRRAALRSLCPSLFTLVALSAGCGETPEPLPPVDGGVIVESGLFINVSEPSADWKVAPGVRVPIAYEATGASGPPEVQLLADEDGDLRTTADQHLIVRDAQGRWQTEGVPQGRYHIAARALGGGEERTDWAFGKVEVVAPALTIINVQDGEWLRHGLALLVGTTASADAREVKVKQGGAEATRTWPAQGGRFKALVPLTLGTNALELEVDGVRHAFTLGHEPMENPRFVRFLYILSADGDGTFQAPAGEPNDVESARLRIGTAAELMQTFTAETLHAERLGRRTFSLQRDAEGRPVVEVFRSTLTTAQARAMDGNALWSHFYGELSSLPLRNDTIDVAIMSMTHYDGSSGEVFAHTALGGGRLGLFGSGALHTWAQSLDEVVTRFNDGRMIDTTQLFDDSAFRGTHWANYATGIGATLHELGHCLSLPHPANGKGVMAREFDHFNRTFTVTEPASNTSPGYSPLLASQEIGWDRSAAVRLRFHRWLEPTVREFGGASQAVSDNATTVTVSSPYGIRHIAWSQDGSVAGHEEHLDEVAPATLTFTKSALRTRFPGATALGVSSIDDQGNISERTISLQ